MNSKRNPSKPKLSQRSNGSWRLRFTFGSRRWDVTLPAMSDSERQTVAAHVESIISARQIGVDPPPMAYAWHNTIGDAFHGRLAKTGLLEPRQPTEPETMPTITVVELIDGFIESREKSKSVKPATVNAWNQARNQLVAYFGADRPIDEITVGDTKDWQRSLNSARQHGESYAEATKRKWAGFAKQFFEDAIDRELIDRNPFRKLKSGSVANRERNFFVSHESIKKVIQQCPDAEWRLIVALSRYGGLRCPSEHFALKWEHVLWDLDRMRVQSPKTAHQGKEERIVPIFPELEPYLLEVAAQTPDRAEYVIQRHRHKDNLRSQLTRMVKRAGLTPWPRIFHNLRASRQTELNDEFPEHVVCQWIGNTKAVAREHYDMVTDDHFAAAARKPAPLLPRKRDETSGKKDADLTSNVDASL